MAQNDKGAAISPFSGQNRPVEAKNNMNWPIFGHFGLKTADFLVSGRYSVNPRVAMASAFWKRARPVFIFRRPRVS
jgi:hypothetical protein